METIRYNRFIRFKLQSDKTNTLIEEKIASLSNSDNKEFDLVNFFSNLGDYLSDFYDYIFSEKEDQGTIVKGYMSVKNDWIKSYARQAYAGFVESEKTNKETKRQRV